MAKFIKQAAIGVFCAAVGTAAAAQESDGRISMGFAWSSLRGPVGSLGVEVADAFGRDLDISAEYQRGQTGSGGKLLAQYRRPLQMGGMGQDLSGFVRLEGAVGRWDEAPFASDRGRLSLGVEGARAGGLSWSAATFWQYDAISDVKSDASPLLAAAESESHAAGLSFGLGVDRLGPDPLAQSGYAVRGELTWAGLSDRKFASVAVQAAAAVPLGSGASLAFQGEAGVIGGLDGQDVTLVDRAYIGGRSLRGFAAGGAGPRDYVAGSTDTPLGGNRYATVSVEARQQATDRLTLAAFVDMGAAWDLDGTPVGAMGPIDDAAYMRSSAGLAAYFETGVGTFSLSVAKPLASRPGDETNMAALGLVSRF